MSTIISDLISHLQLGETVSANDAIYIKSADSKAYKFDVNDDTQVYAGIAKEAGVLNDYVRVAQTGRIKGFTGLTAGAFVYASTSAAGGFQLTEPADNLKVILGIAKSATELVINGGLGIKPGGAGGSGGGFDGFYTEDFSSTGASDLQKTGTITVADETVNPISGDKSIKITQVAGSLGAIVKSKAADLGLVLDINQKDNLISLKGRYKYDGLASEYDFVIYDETNAAELGRLSLVPSEAVKTFRLLANTISTTATLSYYFEVMVENIGAILEIDNVEGQVNPLPTAESVESETVTYTGYTSKNGSNQALLSTEFKNSSSGLISVTNTDHTRYTFLKRTSFSASVSLGDSIGNETSLDLYDSNDVLLLRSQERAGDTGKVAYAMTSEADVGDYLVVVTIDPVTDPSTNFSVTAQATSANVVFEGATSEVDIVVEGAGNAGTVLTANVTNIDFTEVADVGNNFNGTQFTVPDNGIYDLNGGVSTTVSTADVGVDLYVGGVFRRQLGFNGAATTHRTFSGSESFNKGDVVSFRMDVSLTLSNVTRHALTINKQAINPLFSVPVTNEVENHYYGYVTDAATPTFGASNVNFIESISKGATGVYTITLKSGFFSVAPTIDVSPVGDGLMHNVRSASTTTVVIAIYNNAGVLDDSDFYVYADRSASDYRAPKGYFLGNLSQPVAYLKDIKSSGTAGGTFTSGAWQSRILNTLEGSNSWISIDTEGATKTTGTDGDARRFTLEAGTYEIEGSAPSKDSSINRIKLYNITDASDEILSPTAVSAGGGFERNLKGEIKITTSKTFELQHRGTVTRVTDGFGPASSFGVSEVFSQISIRKLK